MKLEIAAGNNPQKMEAGWIRHDLRALPNIDVICNWRYLPDFLVSLGYKEIDEIYCRHFIEHLTIGETEQFLSICRYILYRRGLLVIATPNMEWLCKKYVSGGYTDPSEFVYWVFGEQDANWNYHKSLYDCDLLARLMRDAGFDILAVERQGYELKVTGEKR